MRALIQRVSSASVQIDNKVFSKIGNGLLVLLGIENEDSDSDIEWLSSKISQMRIFDDKNDHMNLSVNDINGEVLVVSQFTLHASTKKGNRPSYIRASKPDHAVPMYEAFILQMKDKILNGVSSGQFGACMQVDLVNDGPVTIWIDSKSRE
ncbi:MAG: D-aminoacyl-tRNA deacylase [Verrucomicrobiales bacterium]|mgnify:FL=1|nr:D-tyrosyl-tRNA(Tyr) deacylase [Verrucomicrobiales bacterium]